MSAGLVAIGSTGLMATRRGLLLDVLPLNTTVLAIDCRIFLVRSDGDEEEEEDGAAKQCVAVMDSTSATTDTCCAL